MLRRSHYIAVSLVVLLTLVLLNLPSQTTARLKLGIGSLFLPLVGLAQSSQHLAGKATDALLPRREILRQNEALRRDNQELRLQATLAEGTERENAHLRQLLGWQQHQRRSLKLAKVILREPSNWWRAFEIDLGARDGMTTNRTVLSPDGSLVGRISSVRLTRSQVLLLGDPNVHVAALVENETRDMGVIGVSGPLDSGLVELGYLSKNTSLKAGQNVRTSGQGGIFPPDILIGQIVDSQSIEYGFGTVARVKLAARLDALDEVWVLTE
jgi:rod shape-determining protein MreC